MMDNFTFLLCETILSNCCNYFALDYVNNLLTELCKLLEDYSSVDDKETISHLLHYVVVLIAQIRKWLKMNCVTSCNSCLCTAPNVHIYNSCLSMRDIGIEILNTLKTGKSFTAHTGNTIVRFPRQQ